MAEEVRDGSHAGGATPHPQGIQAQRRKHPVSLQHDTPKFRGFLWQREPAMPVDESPQPVQPRRIRSRIQLATHADVVKELKRLHMQVEGGEITAIEGVRRAKILNQLASAMTQSSIERRLATIEKSLERRR